MIGWGATLCKSVLVGADWTLHSPRSLTSDVAQPEAASRALQGTTVTLPTPLLPQSPQLTRRGAGDTLLARLRSGHGWVSKIGCR